MNNYFIDIKRLKNTCKNKMNFLSELFSPGFVAISVYRFFNFCIKNHIPILMLRFPVEKITELVCGISIPSKCKIGSGLRIQHFGGIVLHDTVEIGCNATIYHGVTIGLGRDKDVQAPVCGDNIYIGTGAKILGEITIGDNVIIGANAVVLNNIPNNCTVAGMPAKIVKINNKL